MILFIMQPNDNFRVSVFLHRKFRCFLVAALLYSQASLPVQGAKVIIPLAISFDFLILTMGEQIKPAYTRPAV
ncbi:MAG: hypothetical protein ACU84H_15970 [Gammaproteobacteria bacterium]